VAHQTSLSDALVICAVNMDGRRQPARLLMPHELPAPGADVGERRQRRRPGDLRCAPRPATCAGSVRGSIGGPGGAPHPGGRRAPPLHGTAWVPRGRLPPQAPSGRGHPLRALRPKRPAALGGPACHPRPIDALGAERPRANQGGPVALPGRRPLDQGALAPPAAVDVGGGGALRGSDHNDGDRPWRWPDAEGGAPGCHPGVVFSARGAVRGPVWAKRVSPQTPAGRGRRPVASRTAAGWVAQASRRRLTLQPSAREPQGLGRWPQSGARGAVTCWRGRPSWLGGGAGVLPGPRGEPPGARGAGGLVAVEPPGKLRDPPARRRQEHGVPARGAWWPGTPGRCSQGVCRRGQDQTPAGDSSPAGA
jgi:hypothetical protein